MSYLDTLLRGLPALVTRFADGSVPKITRPGVLTSRDGSSVDWTELSGSDVGLTVPAAKTWYQKTDGSEPIGIDSAIHVDLYGAVGDGVTNDNAAFIAAITACPAGGVVELGRGKTYLVTQVLINKALTLRGNGANVLMAVRADGDGRACVRVTADDVRITGELHIDGNKPNQPAVTFAQSVGSETVNGMIYRCGVFVDGVSGFEIDHCEVHHCQGGGVINNNSDHVKVHHNNIHHTYYEAVAHYSEESIASYLANPTDPIIYRVGNTIKDNRLNTIGRAAVDGFLDVIPTWSGDGLLISFCQGAEVSGNIADTVDMDLLKLEWCKDPNVHHNYGKKNLYATFCGFQTQGYTIGGVIEHNTLDGFSTGFGLYSGSQSQSPSGLRVRNNTVRNTWGDTSLSASVNMGHGAMLLGRWKDVGITDNTFEDLYGGGVVVRQYLGGAEPATDIGIYNNTVNSPGQDIQIDTTAGFSIDGLSIKGTRGTGKIRITGGNNNVRNLHTEDNDQEVLSDASAVVQATHATRSRSGSLLFSGSNTQQSVIFDTPEPDNSYDIVYGVSRTYGAATVTTPYTGVRTALGFDVHLPSAPGAGTAVDIGWQVVRSSDKLVKDIIQPPVSFLPAHAPGIWFRADHGLLTTPVLGVSRILSCADVTGGIEKFTAVTGAEPALISGVGGLACMSGPGACLHQPVPRHIDGPHSFCLVFRFKTALATDDYYPLATLRTFGNKVSQILAVTAAGYAGLSWTCDAPGPENITSVGTAWTPDTSLHTLVVTYSGGTNTDADSYTCALDGVSKTVVTSGPFGIDSTLDDALFAFTSGSILQHTIDAEIYEYIEADATWNGSELGALQTYLHARYGL